MTPTTGLYAVLFFLFQIVIVQSIVNNEVSQVIDASTSIVRYNAEIKASNVNGEYSLLFLKDWGSHLAYLSVTSKGKPLKVLPAVT